MSNRKTKYGNIYRGSLEKLYQEKINAREQSASTLGLPTSNTQVCKGTNVATGHPSSSNQVRRGTHVTSAAAPLKSQPTKQVDSIGGLTATLGQSISNKPVRINNLGCSELNAVPAGSTLKFQLTTEIEQTENNSSEPGSDSGSNSGTDSGTDSEAESEANSCTLGEEDSAQCTPGVRQISPTKDATSGSCAAQTEGIGEVPPHDRPSFVSLFADNRQQSSGSMLPKFAVGDGPVKILEEDLEGDPNRWKFCLVGYFGGRFPGKVALQQIVSSWKAEVTIHHHTSGWIIFQFEDEESQIQVLQGGPYLIFGRPLLLKIMPKFFNFRNEELSKLPVWVQLYNLPLEVWGPKALGRICSKLGKPIYMDKLTTSMQRVSFARALIEVDVAAELEQCIRITLPNGDTIDQPVYYENLPKFCTHCNAIGHSFEGCRAKNRAVNKAQPSKPATLNGKKGNSDQVNLQAAPEANASVQPAILTASAAGAGVNQVQPASIFPIASTANDGVHQVQPAPKIQQAAPKDNTSVQQASLQISAAATNATSVMQQATLQVSAAAGGQKQTRVQAESMNQMPIVSSSQMENRGNDKAAASLHGQTNKAAVQPHPPTRDQANSQGTNLLDIEDDFTVVTNRKKGKKNKYAPKQPLRK